MGGVGGGRRETGDRRRKFPSIVNPLMFIGCLYRRSIPTGPTKKVKSLLDSILACWEPSVSRLRSPVSNIPLNNYDNYM